MDITWYFIDDWFGLYKDGTLIDEGHSMEETSAFLLGLDIANECHVSEVYTEPITMRVKSWDGPYDQFHGTRMPESESELPTEGWWEAKPVKR